MGTNVSEPRPGKLPEVLLGAVLIVSTTFVPYLNLVNIFPFGGVILSGAIATWIYIMRHQLPLSYRQAFNLGAQSGFVGSSLIMLAIYLMLERARNLSLTDFQKLLSEWGGRLPSDSTELYRQVMMVVTAPLEVKALSFLVSLLLVSLILAPLAGLGARLVVLILKRQAGRS